MHAVTIMIMKKPTRKPKISVEPIHISIPKNFSSKFSMS